MQLQISYLEDYILIELHLGDDWVKFMWCFCIRCGCQVQLVALEHSEECQCSETIFAACWPKPKFSVGFLELGLSEAVCHSIAEGPWGYVPLGTQASWSKGQHAGVGS